MIAVASVCSSCKDDGETPNPVDSAVPNEASISQFLAADQAFSQTFIGLSQMVINPEAEELNARATDCAEFLFSYKKEGELHITSLGFDFGQGCETEDGDFISGKVLLTLEGAERQFGAISLELDNFVINDTLLNGKLTGSLIVDEKGRASLRGELSNGFAQYNNGDFISLDFDKQFAWIEGGNTSLIATDDVFEITGEGSYISTVEGSEYAYNFNISTPIEFKSECAEQGLPFFTQGDLEINYSDIGSTSIDNFFSIDYGVGECDADVLLNIDGEEVETQLWRFWFL